MNKSYDTNMEKIQIYIIIFSHSCLSPLLVEHNRSDRLYSIKNRGTHMRGKHPHGIDFQVL
jgi:hypothetical protein